MAAVTAARMDIFLTAGYGAKCICLSMGVFLPTTGGIPFPVGGGHGYGENETKGERKFLLQTPRLRTRKNQDCSPSSLQGLNESVAQQPSDVAETVAEKVAEHYLLRSSLTASAKQSAGKEDWVLGCGSKKKFLEGDRV